MAQYKIQRAKGVEGSTIYTYTAPGHNECVPTRLHDPADVDGGKMPKRKAAMFDMGSEQESLICFKHDAGVYKMVYQTLGYTAIRQVNEDGSFAKEEIRVVSNSTLNTKCVPPTVMAQAIADRFSGAYAEQTATESENANQTADAE